MLGQAEEGIFDFSLDPEAIQWRCRPNGVTVVDFDEFSPRRNTTLERYDVEDTNEYSGPLHCAVLTDTAVLLYDEDGTYVTALQPPLKLEEGNTTSYRVGMSDSGVYYLLERTDSGTYIRIATRKGVVLSDTLVQDSAAEAMVTSKVEFDWLALSQPGIPVLFTIGVVAVGKTGDVFAASNSGNPVADLMRELGYNWRYGMWYLAILVGVWLFHRRHLRHQSLTRWQRWPWLLAWFLFPLITPFVYFGAMEWQRLVRCPQCGGRRPVDREQCPQCGSAFPRSAAKGIELIVPPPAA